MGLLDPSSTTLLIVFISTLFCASAVNELDPNGYILYCPCMGRFGNQAEHFLGSLAFAKTFNRTLVLPPWVEYIPGNPRSVQVPFTKYFKVEPLEEYHRVMPMEDFMADLAPEIWPEGKRNVYCYRARPKIGQNNDEADSCNAKDGNPFGPFWDTFGIEFDESIYYGPLSFGANLPSLGKRWSEKFPSSQHYVMAFTGAPASFPVSERHVELMQYLQWSDEIEARAKKFITKYIGKEPFLGIHLRNGIDFVRACDRIYEKQNFFGSAQCLGYRMEHGLVSQKLCLPSDEDVLQQVKKAATKIHAKVIFVATDNDPMIEKIQQYFDGNVQVVRSDVNSPHLDLAILTKADHYICNCISTFSAFATRYRLTHGDKPTSFWNFDGGSKHDEL